MASTDQTGDPGAPETPGDKQARTYQALMDFGFGVGLPVAGGIVVFVALMLLKAGFFVSIALSILAWLGLYGIAKTFFMH